MNLKTFILSAIAVIGMATPAFAKAGVAMPITAMAERINVFKFIILGKFKWFLILVLFRLVQHDLIAGFEVYFYLADFLCEI